MISEYFNSFSFYGDGYSSCLFEEIHQWGDFVIAVYVATEA